MILLNGGAYYPNSQVADAPFVKALKPHDKIVFIPAATTKSQETYFTFFKEKMQHYGFENVKWVNLYSSDWREQIGTPKMVYIAGGDTFKLMSIVRESKFGDWLKQHQNEMIIVGNSAGAVILGSDIRSTNDANQFNETDFKGLVLVPFMVNPHFKEDLERVAHLKKLSAELKEKIICIPEGAEVVIDNNVLQQIGNIKIIEGKKHPAIDKS